MPFTHCSLRGSGGWSDRGEPAGRLRDAQCLRHACEIALPRFDGEQRLRPERPMALGQRKPRTVRGRPSEPRYLPSRSGLQPMNDLPRTPASHEDLPRTVASREELADLLRRLFPEAEGDLSPIRGGRREAERLLAAIDPIRYGVSRNHLDGAVTRLSPYIRHGVLTLAEVRDAVFAWLAARQPTVPGQVEASARGPGEPELTLPVQGELFTAATPAGGCSRGRRRGGEQRPGAKLIQELGWRDYWQRLWREWGDGIWADREPLRTGRPPGHYAPDLPADIAGGRIGLACMDAFAADLERTGSTTTPACGWPATWCTGAG
jgi:deoxyribodipyrimidine photo-lyase